ncbi:hypothetical protein CBR_g24315 [Chara braunii]|uniref:Uncharacterized protein n=1 Tax=Chara braunii TaxID=69332 RepID=A0A388JMI9_CHABU|nr:hypothetical protein CBR_g24315 [Chara braunii]|eukprot:GBG58965.1 hypothetical protein CBR_g24315 [Chara braunii]
MKGKSVDASGGDAVNEEGQRLCKENDDLKRKLSEALCPAGEDRVLYLQKEVMELRRKVGDKQVNKDVITALKTEISELKQSAFMKTNFEQEITGLRKEVSLLRDQNERVVSEAGQWREQALRPGNKRGSVVLLTPEVTNRGSSKPRWTDNVWEGEKWKAEYRNLQSLHRFANIEAEALKEKRAEVEARRMEAKNQVKVLEEKMEKLMVSGEKGNEGNIGGTNLKERLEEAALRSARKGVKAMPGRTGVRAASSAARLEKEPILKQVATSINDRTEFIEEQKRQLRMLRKAGLELLYKEEGVKLGKFEDTVCDLAKARNRKTFGDVAGPSKGTSNIQEVSDDASRSFGDAEEDEGKSVEL